MKGIESILLGNTLPADLFVKKIQQEASLQLQWASFLRFFWLIIFVVNILNIKLFIFVPVIIEN